MNPAAGAERPRADRRDNLYVKAVIAGRRQIQADILSGDDGCLPAVKPWFCPDSWRSHCAGRPAKIFGSYQKLATEPCQPWALPSPAICQTDLRLPGKQSPCSRQSATPKKKAALSRAASRTCRTPELRSRKVRVDAERLRCPAAPDRQNRVPAELAHQLDDPLLLGGLANNPANRKPTARISSVPRASSGFAGW